MSGLDHLTNKILDDAKKRADEITGAADAKAKAVVDEAVAEASRERERIMAEAKAEAQRAAEQVTLSKTLAVRDRNLGAKQQLLEKVFAQALSELGSLPEDAYRKFLFSNLEALNPDGDEIILPAKYSVTVDEINAHLKSKGKNGSLLPCSDGRSAQSGFILSKNRIEQNYTMESLAGYYRYELEGEVLKTLY